MLHITGGLVSGLSTEFAPKMSLISWYLAINMVYGCYLIRGATKPLPTENG